MESHEPCETGYRIRDCGNQNDHGPHDWGKVAGLSPLHCPGRAREMMICTSTEPHGTHIWGHESSSLGGPWRCVGIAPLAPTLWSEKALPPGSPVCGDSEHRHNGPCELYARSSGAESTQPNPALSDVPLDVYEASRLRDGDTLVLVAEDIGTSADHIRRTREYLEHVLPGIRVVIVAGFRHALVHERDRIEERKEG